MTSLILWLYVNLLAIRASVDPGQGRRPHAPSRECGGQPSPGPGVGGASQELCGAEKRAKVPPSPRGSLPWPSHHGCGGQLGASWGPARSGGAQQTLPRQGPPAWRTSRPTRENPPEQSSRGGCIFKHSCFVCFSSHGFSLPFSFHNPNPKIHPSPAPAATVSSRTIMWASNFTVRVAGRPAGNTDRTEQGLKITRKGKKTLESLRPNLLARRAHSDAAGVVRSLRAPSREPPPPLRLTSERSLRKLLASVSRSRNKTSPPPAAPSKYT